MALTLNPDFSYLSPTLIRRALLHAPPARLLLRVRSITFAQQDELSFYYHVPFHMLTSWASPSGPHLPCAYYALTTYRVRTVYGRHRPRLAGCAATRIAAGGRRRGAPHRVRGDAGMHVHCSMRTAHCTLHKRDTHAAHTRACACARASCSCCIMCMCMCMCHVHVHVHAPCACACACSVQAHPGDHVMCMSRDVHVHVM